jgi:hypothetical protein
MGFKRLYLPSTGAAAVSPAFDSGWEHATATADRIAAVTTRISSSMTSKTATKSTSSVADTDGIARQYVSDPLAAQTITGTLKGQVRAMESATSANMRSQIVVRVVSNDGSTERGVLYPGDLHTHGANANANPTNEFGTSLANRRFPRSGFANTLTSVTTEDGDRLVIEIGFRHHLASSTATVGTFSFGDNSGTDLPENDTTTTANNPWVEFSNTIYFQGETIPILAQSDASTEISYLNADIGGTLVTGGAQRFSLTDAADITDISVGLMRVGSPPGNLRIELLTSSGTVPSSTVLGTSGTMAATSVSNVTITWYTFTFSTPVSLSAATDYWFAIRNSNDTTSSSNIIGIYGSSTDVYAGHPMAQRQNGSWLSVSTYDLGFAIYGTAGALPVTISGAVATASGMANASKTLQSIPGSVSAASGMANTSKTLRAIPGSVSTASGLAPSSKARIQIAGALSTASGDALAGIERITIPGSVSLASGDAFSGILVIPLVISGSVAAASGDALAGSLSLLIPGSLSPADGMAYGGTMPRLVTGSVALASGDALSGSLAVLIPGGYAIALGDAYAGTIASAGAITVGGSVAEAFGDALAGFPIYPATVAGSVSLATGLALASTPHITPLGSVAVASGGALTGQVRSLIPGSMAAASGLALSGTMPRTIAGAVAVATGGAATGQLFLTIRGAQAPASGAALTSKPRLTITGATSLATGAAYEGTVAIPVIILGSLATASGAALTGKPLLLITGSTGLATGDAFSGNVAIPRIILGSVAIAFGEAYPGTLLRPGLELAGYLIVLSGISASLQQVNAGLVATSFDALPTLTGGIVVVESSQSTFAYPSSGGIEA